MTASGGIETVRLGRTNVEVPRICFGSGPLGDLPNSYGYRVSEERGLETVRAIFAGPARFIDTARNYGFGRSEERIGKVIRELGGLPEGGVISTKLRPRSWRAIASTPRKRGGPWRRAWRSWASTASNCCTCTIPNTRPRSARSRRPMVRWRNCSR